MFRRTCEEILSKAEDRGTAATPQRVQLLPWLVARILYLVLWGVPCNAS